MTRSAHPTRRPTREERAFFEELVALRQWYASRGTDDGMAVATVHHVIAVANAAMRRAVEPARTAAKGIDAN
jgi:hypothetical protein